MNNLILKLKQKSLNEGIDIRLSPYRNVQEVSITDKHENGVDTSISNNPTKKIYTMDDDNKITIYSIFQRNSGIKHMDGNPLLYALKKEKGFAFASPYEEKQFWLRFENILDKFIKQYNNEDIVVISQTNPKLKGTTGILVPSSKPINKKIADILATHSGITIIDNILKKKNWLEIFKSCNNKKSYFYKYWNKRNKADYMLEYLYDKYVTDDTFRIHSIDKEDNELRKTITNTLKLSDNIEDYYPEINGKHILIIDDTITMCQTFKSAYNVIVDNYTPKSITGLTMFSEKI